MAREKTYVAEHSATRRAMQQRNQKLGLPEAAQPLGIPYQQAHRLVLVGVLPGEKRSGRWAVSAASVRRLARSRLVATLVNTRTTEVADGAQELEGLVSVYEGRFEEIQEILG